MIVDVPNTSSSTSASLSVWKQERLVFKVQETANIAVGVWTNLHGSYSSPMVLYTVPSSGVLYVDMSDYARTYADTLTKITVYGGYKHEYTITFAGLINPVSVIIPGNSLASAGALIVPPTMLICAFDNNDLEEAEFYKVTGTWGVTGHASISLDKRKIGRIRGSFTLGDGTHFKTYNPRPMRCDVRYALVRWVSFTGQTRTHWLEVVKVKTDASAGYNLLPIDNEYVEIKGRVDGFTLRLDGLTAYDMWYYADMVTSSKVEVSLDGTNYDRVQVSTKTFIQPDGENNDGKFEINVNWKRYDAVAM